MSLVPEPRALAVDALSQDWQGRSMYMFPPFPLLNKAAQDHPGGRGDTNRPLVAVTTVVSTLTTSVCGPPMLLSIPGYISSGKSYHLHDGGSYAQHYQEAGFSKKVSKLAKAPRRPSTNRMYDDRTGGHRERI